MEMAQGELSRAIESGDATAQVNAQKELLHYQLMKQG